MVIYKLWAAALCDSPNKERGESYDDAIGKARDLIQKVKVV